MTANLLWNRVEDARLKWQRAHQHVMEISDAPDGSDAHSHALDFESVAVKAYHRALQELQSAVAPNTEAKSVLTPREREVLTLTRLRQLSDWPRLP